MNLIFLFLFPFCIQYFVTLLWLLHSKWLLIQINFIRETIYNGLIAWKKRIMKMKNTTNLFLLTWECYFHHVTLHWFDDWRLKFVKEKQNNNVRSCACHQHLSWVLWVEEVKGLGLDLLNGNIEYFSIFILTITHSTELHWALPTDGRWLRIPFYMRSALFTFQIRRNNNLQWIENNSFLSNTWCNCRSGIWIILLKCSMDLLSALCFSTSCCRYLVIVNIICYSC